MACALTFTLRVARRNSEFENSRVLYNSVNFLFGVMVVMVVVVVLVVKES